MTRVRSSFVGLSAVLAATVATPAAADWREASSDHFIIYADASEDWLTGFATRLEKLNATLRFLQPQQDEAGERANRLVIYAVSGVDAVQKLCGKCGSIAGFYVPRVGSSVAYTARTTTSNILEMTSDAVLQHEFAHHFMYANSGAAYPKWYSEGFAEFFSTAQVEKDGRVSIGRAATHRAYNLVNNNLRIERVIEPPAKMDAEMGDIFYGRAWLLTHMLTFDKARSGQHSRYVALINEGKPNMEAAKAAFGDLDQLERQLNAYVRKPLSYVSLPADKTKIGEIKLRLLTPGEAQTMSVRMRSDRGVDRAAATALVPEARRRAAPFASDPGAQMVLAEAEYDAGNDAEADAAADRALAADPKNVEALLYKGRVAVRRAIAARADAKGWAVARGWFIKANRIDSNAAEPLMLFYTSFKAAGDEPTNNAKLALARAFQLSPQDRGLRIMAAFQLLSDDKAAEARRALLPLAFDPHFRGEVNPAARIVAMIDAKTPTAEILRNMSAAADVIVPTD